MVEREPRLHPEILAVPKELAFFSSKRFERLGIAWYRHLLDIVRSIPPEDDPLGLISGGCYAASLKPYLRMFEDRLLLLLHDDVLDDPQEVYDRALRHIGATLRSNAPDVTKAVHSYRGQFRNPIQRAWHMRRALSGEQRRTVYSYFRDDIAELEQMLDRDLSRWQPP